MKLLLPKTIVFVSLFSLISAVSATVKADGPIVPGTGRLVDQVGDDFEAEDWDFIFQGVKSTENIDENRRLPAGYSKNGRWYEGIKRGYPDVVKRVETPEGGLAGSKYSLLMRSLQTGIPGSPSYKLQQDDFICAIHTRMGLVPVSKSPNCVTRVYLPPVDEWENRTGPHFAMRLSLITTVTKAATGKGLFRAKSSQESETYWPGMFIEFVSKNGTDVTEDSAWLRLRADRRGIDYKGIPINVTGWWTLGMSVTPDGQVHYFAKPGIEDLTMKDYLGSQFPYSYRAEQFQTFFYNVCNGDDGRTWSSNWIIDDPKFYLVD